MIVCCNLTPLFFCLVWSCMHANILYVLHTQDMQIFKLQSAALEWIHRENMLQVLFIYCGRVEQRGTAYSVTVIHMILVTLIMTLSLHYPVTTLTPDHDPNSNIIQALTLTLKVTYFWQTSKPTLNVNQTMVKL